MKTGNELQYDRQTEVNGTGELHLKMLVKSIKWHTNVSRAFNYYHFYYFLQSLRRGV